MKKYDTVFRQNKENVHIFILFKSFHPQLLMLDFSFWSISEHLNLL